MPFTPSYPLITHLVHSCGGVAEAQELINAINTAIPAIPLPVSDGGTGVTSFDPNSVLITDGFNNLTFAHAGFAGDVFMSTGLTSPPDFITIGGDILIAGDGTAAIQPHVVTFFQMQQISAHTLLGNSTGSTASVQEITLAKRLAFSSTTLDVVVDAAANLFIGGGGASVTGNTSGLLGVGNIGIGGQSFSNADPFVTLLSITDGNNNVAIGNSIAAFLTSGSNNVAIGDLALGSASTGSFNFALGPSSLVALSDGAGNVAIGSGSGTTITHGSQNVLIGGNTNVKGASQNNSIAIGTGAKANAANHCVLGGIVGSGTDVVLGFSGNTIPNSSDIDAAGQGFIYWDLTPGRAGFRFVGKDTGGTVFAGGMFGNDGGVAFFTSDVSTTHTNGTFDNIFNVANIGGALANNGDNLIATYSLVTVAHATATRQIKISFGGTTIYDSTAQATASIANIDIKVLVVRVSSSVVRCTVSFSDNLNLSAFPGAQYTEVTGLTLSTSSLLVTAAAAGAGAASADIVGKVGFVKFQQTP